MINIRPGLLLALLLAAGAACVLAGVLVGSTGWADLRDEGMGIILWEIRLPRSLGAWWAGALLGMAGAMSQGLFRNPLADPYLLGSASGAGLAVAVALALTGVSPQTSSLLAHIGLTGMAFVGTLLGVGLTLMLARGVEQTLRLLLAGVVVGVVLNALTGLATLWAPDILRAMQAFLLFLILIYLVAGLELALHAGPVAVGGQHSDLAQAHLAVGHRVDEGSGRPALHGRRRHDERVLQRVELQAHIDELVGEEAAALVLEQGLDLDGAGGGVDGVVGAGHAPLGQHLPVVAVPGLDGQGLLVAELLADARQARIRHGEDDGRRLRLRDAEQAVEVSRRDVVAEVGLLQAGLARDWRDDLGVGELQLGVVQRGLVGQQGGLELAHQSELGVELLAWRGFLGDEVLVAEMCIRDS